MDLAKLRLYAEKMKAGDNGMVIFDAGSQDTLARLALEAADEIERLTRNVLDPSVFACEPLRGRL